MRARFGRWFAFAIVSLLMASGLVGLATPGDAYIGTVSGQILRILPPSSVQPTGITDATRMFAFDEQQGITLAAPMKVDFTTPGIYTDTGTAKYVAAGTVVDSHFVHSARPANGTAIREGTLTFAQDIVGVIASRGKLVDSDGLAAPGTIYPGALPSRELEFGGGDWLQIVNARTLFLHLNTTTVVDHVRVLTKHNSEPTVDSGSSYSGYEGSAIPLSGSVTDPDGDPVTYGWTFTYTGDAGVMCTMANANTLTPSVSCTDDATVTATLSANDAYHAAVTNVATVSVINRDPTSSALTLPTAQIPLGGTANLHSTFADAGTNDTHTGDIAWGDSNVTSATVSDATHSVDGSHIYTTSGTFTVTLTLHDDDGGVVTATGEVHVNGPPTGSANGPYVGVEGSSVGLSGTASDPDNPSLTTTWAFTPGASDAGTACNPTGSNTLTPSIACTDDVVVGAALTIDDGVNPAVISNTTVSIENAPPTVGVASAAGGPFVVGQNIAVSAPFTDPGVNDTHTASINWGDLASSTGTVLESPGTGTGTASGSHAYSTPGPKTITITVTDDDGGSDSRTLNVVVNAAPTVEAGGPYTGYEGTPNALSGTASDADGDTLAISWTFTWTGSGSGVVCTATNTNTTTPFVTCNDDTVVSAVMTVNDGVNGNVTDNATLVVGNLAPTGGPIVASPLTVGVNTNVNVSVPFSDPGTHDTHTAVIDWGDTTSSTGTVSELLGAGTVTGSHSYATSGSYTITVTITDDNGGSVVITAPSNVAVNGPPVVDAGSSAAGNEGSAILLSGSVTDTDPTTKLWTFTWTGSGSGVVCTATNITTLSPSVTCNDNTLVTAVLTANDGINASVSDATTIAVANVAPSLGAVGVSASMVPVGTSVNASVSFSDAGTHDTHTATVTWDDAAVTGATVSETNGAGTASGSHVYTAPGIYSISITVTDDDTGATTSTATSYVVVYDASGGRVTGGTNFPSPSGAYTPNDPLDTNYIGDAHIGFNVRYNNPGDTVPNGQADFRFNAADLDFKATGFTWLVVENSQTRAYFRGTGKVNNVAGYDFLVSIIDGAPVDAVRIQVSNHATGEVLYDMQPGAPDDAAPTMTLGSDGVQIHP